MRSPEAIQLKIKLCKAEMNRLSKEYSDMHQIDMQSGEGYNNRKNYHIQEGMVKALEWLLVK